MKLKVIESETLQESVYNALVDAILSGRIAPGERITLESIAKQLNVSIMPVREAVRRLQARDFVSVERNRRITVRELSPESLAGDPGDQTPVGVGSCEEGGEVPERGGTF